jgi:hypothetical protein
MLTEWEKSPVSSTYSSFLEPDARIQPVGHLPSVNRDTIKLWITHLPKTLTWRPVGSGAATSGDLGFTYGLLKIPGNPDVPKGHYVRIWKKRPGENWMILLEMMNMN